MAETHTSYDRLTMEPLDLKTFGQRLRALRLEAEQTQDVYKRQSLCPFFL